MFNVKMNDSEAKQMQPLVLAMIGDGVQTLFVREYIARKYGVKVNKMNKLVSSVVSAKSQFLTFKEIEPLLDEDESSIAHRARNANIHTKAKNFSFNEYIHATALEAVVGYLYLTQKEEKLNQILNLSIKQMDLSLLKNK